MERLVFSWAQSFRVEIFFIKLHLWGGRERIQKAQMTPEFHAEVGFWNNSFYAELGNFLENCSQPTSQRRKSNNSVPAHSAACWPGQFQPALLLPCLVCKYCWGGISDFGRSSYWLMNEKHRPLFLLSSVFFPKLLLDTGTWCCALIWRRLILAVVVTIEALTWNAPLCIHTAVDHVVPRGFSDSGISASLCM